MAHKINDQEQAYMIVAVTSSGEEDGGSDLFASPVFYDADFGICYVRHSSLAKHVILDFGDQLERKFDD